MSEVRTIGIIGGGQLGRMLTEAATGMGLKIVVVDPNPDCPAHQVGAEEITADLQDAQAIKELAKRSDIITVEIEHLNADVLSELEAAGKPVHPNAASIKLIQDKLKQNQFFNKNQLPLPRFIK